MSSPFDERKYKRLLEGLRINEVSIIECLQQKDCRFESEFWTQEITSQKKTVKGSEIIHFVQYGTSKELNEEKDGFPILRLNEFVSRFIGIPDKYCNLISNEEYENLRLQKGDVLICRTNGNPNLVGKCALVPENTEYAYASYLFKIRPKTEIINSATLVAFLSCKYGRNEIDKYSMTSNQTNFSPAKFREINIPIFSKLFNDEIDSLYSTAHKHLQQSQSLYRQAEDLLLETIGLKSFKLSTENKNIKSFKNSFLTTGRLDAEYYQKKYEGYEKLVKKYVNGFAYIGKLFTQNQISIDFSAKQYNYIEIGDINTGNGSYNYNSIETNELPANAKIKAEKGNVLISKVRPNRGAVTIIQEDIQDLVVSGAFTVLEEAGNYKKEVLLILLRTDIYRDWLLQFNVGTSYPVIKDDDVLNLFVPLIEMETQHQIASLVQKSFALRRESEGLLEEAKAMVEREVEGAGECDRLIDNT